MEPKHEQTLCENLQQFLGQSSRAQATTGDKNTSCRQMLLAHMYTNPFFSLFTIATHSIMPRVRKQHLVTTGKTMIRNAGNDYHLTEAHVVREVSRRYAGFIAAGDRDQSAMRKAIIGGLMKAWRKSPINMKHPGSIKRYGPSLAKLEAMVRDATAQGDGQ